MITVRPSAAFVAARAAEQRRRMQSYLPQAEPLALPLRTGRVVRVPMSHYRVISELELTLLNSPFLVGGTATPADAWRFLWRMSPDFLRPDGTLPNRGHRRATLLDRMRSARVRFGLSWLVARLSWPAAAWCIRGRLKEARQDEPAANPDAVPISPTAPQHCEYDDLCRYFAGHGYTREQVMDLPVAFVLQFLRSQLLASPEGEIDVIDQSDALFADGAPASPTT